RVPGPHSSRSGRDAIGIRPFRHRRATQAGGTVLRLAVRYRRSGLVRKLWPAANSPRSRRRTEECSSTRYPTVLSVLRVLHVSLVNHLLRVSTTRSKSSSDAYSITILPLPFLSRIVTRTRS